MKEADDSLFEDEELIKQQNNLQQNKDEQINDQNNIQNDRFLNGQLQQNQNPGQGQILQTGQQLQNIVQDQMLQNEQLQGVGKQSERYSDYSFKRHDAIERVWKNMPEKYKNTRSRMYKKRKILFGIQEAEANSYKSEEKYLDQIRTDIMSNNQKNALGDEQDHIANLINSILHLNITADSVKNDETLAKNARNLEILTRRMAVLDEVTDPDNYVNGIEDTRKRQAVRAKIDLMRQISAYYIVRKDVITDETYRKKYDEDISLEITDATSREERVLIGKIMSAHHIAAGFMKKQKTPRLRSDMSREEYEMRNLYGDADTQKSLIKDYRNRILSRKKDENAGVAEYAVPVELDNAMAIKAKLDTMPRDTKAHRNKYYSQKKKYFVAHRDGIKKYIENLEDTQGVKLTKSNKEYLNLLVDLSYQVDVNMNGWHNTERLEKIAGLLDKIKSHKCYKQHEDIIPAFLERELNIGKLSRLQDMIAEYDAMEYHGVLEDIKSDEGGNYYTEKMKSPDFKEIQNVELEFLKNPNETIFSGDTAVSGKLFSEYLGMGKNYLDTKLSFCKDKKGRRHWGRIHQRPFCEDHLWMEKINSDHERNHPEEELRLVYSPQAIRTLSNLAIFNALMGKQKGDDAYDYNLMMSDFEWDATKVKNGKIQQVNAGTVKFVSDIYMFNMGVVFSSITVEDLQRGYEGMPALNAITVPFLDKDFVQMVMNFNPEDLYRISGGNLDRIDVERFIVRFEYIKKLLQDRIDADALLPDDQKTILSKEDWEKKENRERLEKSLQDNEDFFPGLLGDRVEIEGASHEMRYMSDRLNVESEKKEEAEYEKLYESLKNDLLEKKTPEAKVDFMIELIRWQTYHTVGPYNRHLFDTVRSRLLEETVDMAFLKAYQRKKLEALDWLYKEVDKKLNSPDFAVPEEIKKKGYNYTEKDMNTLKVYYACNLIQKENTEKFLEALDYQGFAASLDSVAFSSKVMEADVQEPGYTLIYIDEQLASEMKDGANRAKRVHKADGYIGNYYSTHTSNADPDVIKKNMEELRSLGRENTEHITKKYSLDLELLTPELQEELKIYNEIKAYGDKLDARGVLNQIKRLRDTGEPKAVKMANQFVEDIRDLDAKQKEDREYKKNKYNKERAKEEKAGHPIDEEYEEPPLSLQEIYVKAVLDGLSKKSSK